MRFILLVTFNLAFNYIQSQAPSLTPMFSGFNEPIDIVSNPIDEGMYILELSGTLKYIPDLGKDSVVIVGQLPKVRDFTANGAYGMTFHPSYPDSSFVYIHYTYDTTFFESRLSRFLLDDGVLDVSSEKVIFTDDNLVWFHQGGNPIFGQDGYLYLPKGDGDLNTEPKINGQDPSTFRGAILRIDVDGDDYLNDSRRNYKIPPDNPFVANSNILNEIYAFGFRNPWRMSQDIQSDQIYIGDVGWRSFEEINILKKGRNYGWACFEGMLQHPEFPCFNNADQSDLESPIFAGAHDIFSSITGGFVYRGVNNSSWVGKYIFGDFTSEMICIYDEGNVNCWDKSNSEIIGNFVSFGLDRMNEIYVADHTSGVISRIDEIEIDCTLIPDSLNITSIEQSNYQANEHISIKVQTNNSASLYSKNIEFLPTTQINEGAVIQGIVNLDYCNLRKTGYPH